MNGLFVNGNTVLPKINLCKFCSDKKNTCTPKENHLERSPNTDLFQLSDKKTDNLNSDYDDYFILGYIPEEELFDGIQ